MAEGGWSQVTTAKAGRTGIFYEGGRRGFEVNSSVPWGKSGVKVGAQPARWEGLNVDWRTGEARSDRPIRTSRTLSRPGRTNRFPRGPRTPSVRAGRLESSPLKAG